MYFAVPDTFSTFQLQLAHACNAKRAQSPLGTKIYLRDLSDGVAVKLTLPHSFAPDLNGPMARQEGPQPMIANFKTCAQGNGSFERSRKHCDFTIPNAQPFDRFDVRRKIRIAPHIVHKRFGIRRHHDPYIA